MGRPTRKHPMLREFASPECVGMVERMTVVMGAVQYMAVDQVGKVTVFRLDGPTGSGLLAERREPRPDRPGLEVATESAWIRAALAPGGWLLDGRFHRGAAAADADAAARDDTLAVGEVPPGAIPAFTAGLPPARVRELASKHAPELLA